MQKFEKFFLQSRFATFLAVVFSLFGAVIILIVASYDILELISHSWQYYIQGIEVKDFHDDVLGVIIGAIDLYLMALVILIFSFGVYELFINRIQGAKAKDLNVLEVHSLDQLKDKIAKVIVMVLIVKFFQKVVKTPYNSPLDLLYFAASVFLLALALYFLNKGGKH